MRYVQQERTLSQVPLQYKHENKNLEETYEKTYTVKNMILSQRKCY